MKTAIVKPTEELRKLISFTQQLEEYLEVQSIEELEKDKKAVVIALDRGDLTPIDIIDLRGKFPRQRILMMFSDRDTLFENACIAHDVLLIPSEWTLRQQLDTIQKEWFGLEEQTEYHNVVAFHGTHRQVGVTQTALSVGNILGTFNLKTVVLGLNPYNPGEIINQKGSYSFDQIYDLLVGNLITDGQSLLPYLLKKNDFYYLTGNMDYYKAPEYEKEAVEKLINICKEYFDVVILDIGAFYDNLLPLTALEMSNTHILVSSQEQLSIDDYKRWDEQVLSRFEFFPKARYLVVNKYGSKGIITAKHLEEKLSVPLLLHIPFFPEANDAEIEEGILVLSEFSPYRKAIVGLAKTVSNETGRIGEEKKAKGGFGLFGRRKA